MVPVAGPGLEPGETRQFQIGIVVGADAIDPDDALPAIQEGLCDMVADEACGSGHKDHDTTPG